jgi:hypothetical protein
MLGALKCAFMDTLWLNFKYFGGHAFVCFVTILTSHDVLRYSPMLRLGYITFCVSENCYILSLGLHCLLSLLVSHFICVQTELNPILQFSPI